MISGSVHLLQNFHISILKDIKMLMHQVCSSDPVEMRTYESDNVYWYSFLDWVQYLYIPSTQTPTLWTNSLVIDELRLLSTDVLLHYLQNTLGRREHVEIVLEENLLDYVIALPWIVPRHFEERVKCVVRELAKIQQIQPPSLSSLAKARLAKSTWGLKKIMEMNSLRELLVDC